jgi:hypothetical protein
VVVDHTADLEGERFEGCHVSGVGIRGICV